MDQQYQSLQLTEEEERLIKRLKIKRKVKKIMESNEDIDAKRSFVENLIEEARLKQKECDKRYHIKKRDERLSKMRQYHQEHRDEIIERKRQHYQDNRDDIAAWYYENQQRAIEMLGGRCLATGTTEKLDFAHRTPSDKVFTIAERLNNPYFFNDPKKVEELNKCSLLCRQAHTAYDFTWTSLNYPQNEETFPIWLDSYKDWHSLHKDRMTYREYLINNPIMEITE